MSFWTEQSNILDPKRKFSWWVHFGNLGGTSGGLPHWAAKKTNKPQMTVAEPSHKYLNHTFYYPGSVTWNAIEMTVVDPTNPDVAAALAKAIRDSGYKLPNNQDVGPTTISKGNAVGVFGQVRIMQYNADGRPVEQWTLHNAWLADVNFGDLAYDDEGNLVEITLKFRYDWATLDVVAPGGGGTPQNFGS